MSKPDFVRVWNVSKRYSVGNTTVQALDGVCFQLEEGSFSVIAGKSGCGKSTLLHLLGGLDTPDSGEIRVRDIRIDHMPECELCRVRRRELGFVFQSYNLIPELTARENILFPTMLEKKKVDDAYFKRLVKILNLEDRLLHLPDQLSGGQRQRVAIARSMILKPALILMDEPTGNLDTASSRKIMSGIRTIQREYGQTLLIVTHDMDIAAGADRILHLCDGKLVEKEHE